MGCINKSKAAKLKTGLVSQMRRKVITSLLFLEEASNYALCDKKISCDNAKFIVATIYPNISLIRRTTNTVSDPILIYQFINQQICTNTPYNFI
jgi:hypothetical protein